MENLLNYYDLILEGIGEICQSDQTGTKFLIHPDITEKLLAGVRINRRNDGRTKRWTLDSPLKISCTVCKVKIYFV